jgi:thiosulfate dehydrogenase
MYKEGYDKDQLLIKAFQQLLNLVFCLLLIIVGLVIALIYYLPAYSPETEITSIHPDANGNFTDEAKKGSIKEKENSVNYWRAPAITELEENPDKVQILYGRELIIHTADYFGPNGTISKAFTNGMNCQNCHLDAGTKVFGNNYGSVNSTYPKYRARSGSIENVFKRINDCFERSLNGKTLDTNTREIQAIAAYIKWLGKDVPVGTKAVGSGLKDLPALDRAASVERGHAAYNQKCVSCHQSSGQGIMNTDQISYAYPPLWGTYSYNKGAGLFRISNFAKFIKSNMPLGASYTDPQLTDEEAWDIAAFVNSQPRADKNLKKDWPKIQEKPFDYPFGPYADGFDEQQHKYGPFKPIQEKAASQKKKNT